MSVERELAEQVLQKTNKSRATMMLSIILVAVLLIAGMAGYTAYQKHHEQLVTIESQSQAITAAGVELAAKNAHIDMQTGQLNEAAQQIAKLKDKPPDKIIKTVPVEVVKTVEVERKKSGADFAIVTDPAKPDKKADIKDIEKLPSDTAITLNQYNVHAYKKILRQVDIYPAWSDTIQGKPKLNELDYSISKKVSNDGKYLGVIAGYEFDNEKAKIGIRYTY